VNARDKSLAVKAEADRALNFLASMPKYAHTAVSREVLKEMLQSTDGEMLLRGGLWRIKSRHLGVGVYDVRVEEQKL